MKFFNEDCDKRPTVKAAEFDISVKLLVLALEAVHVPADGNCFLYAARFVLLQLKDWNPTLVPTSVTIRVDVVRFLTNTKMNVLMDGRTLDEVRGKMADPPTMGRRRGTRLEQYDS